MPSKAGTGRGDSGGRGHTSATLSCVAEQTEQQAPGPWGRGEHLETHCSVEGCCPQVQTHGESSKNPGTSSSPYPRQMRTHIHEETCPPLFTGAQFMTTERQKLQQASGYTQRVPHARARPTALNRSEAPTCATQGRTPSPRCSGREPDTEGHMGCEPEQAHPWTGKELMGAGAGEEMGNNG